MEHISIGTRSSQLALWQAEHVASLLAEHGLSSELVTMETTGDKLLTKTIAKIGSKGVFTEELEQSLRQGQTHIAVHSAKDMPSTMAEDLEIIAFTEREEAHDVLVSYNKYFSFDESQRLVLGTSSTRRVAMVRHYYPKIKVVDVRGNLQTRMKKMEEGLCDALVLAYAGVHRMGYNEFVVHRFSTDQFTPAVGQGSLAIQCHRSLPKAIRQKIKVALNHPPTEALLLAERAFLRRLEGGCSIPSFAMARHESGKIHIHGGIISLNGKEIVRKDLNGSYEQAEILGHQLAENVLASGGEAILQGIRKLQH